MGQRAETFARSTLHPHDTVVWRPCVHPRDRVTPSSASTGSPDRLRQPPPLQQGHPHLRQGQRAPGRGRQPARAGDDPHSAGDGDVSHPNSLLKVIKAGDVRVEGLGHLQGKALHKNRGEDLEKRASQHSSGRRFTHKEDGDFHLDGLLHVDAQKVDVEDFRPHGMGTGCPGRRRAACRAQRGRTQAGSCPRGGGLGAGPRCWPGWRRRAGPRRRDGGE